MRIPTDDSLLQAFLAEQYDARTRQRLTEAIERPMPYVDEVGFDRWEVVFDKRDHSVTVFDVLDGSLAGKQRLSVEEFVAAVNAQDK